MDILHCFIIFIYFAVFIVGVSSLAPLFKSNAALPELYDSSEENFSFVFLVLSILLVGVIFVHLYSKYRQRNRIGQFQEFKFDSLCYFMAIALSATILRALLILKDFRGMIMLIYCLELCFIIVCCRFFIFHVGLEIGRFDLQHHKKLIIASIVFHVAITLASLRTTLIEAKDAGRIFEILWSQLGLGIVSGLSTTEFLVVLTGGFRSLEGTLPDSDPIIECNICLMEFSASRIPRILRNCGHTICECCADTLLKQKFNLWIACPMCKTVTEVYGNASKELTKNHAVLEFVEGIKTE